MTQSSSLNEIAERLSHLESALVRIERSLAQMEALSHGGRTTYMGNGLVLVKAVIQGVTILYLVEGNDRLISPWFIGTGRYELELTDFFLRILRPEDHCLDIGANFGYFTLLFGRFCPKGKSLGLEPVASLYETLRDSIHINGLGQNTKVRRLAVCDTERELTLFQRMGRSGNTSIHRVGDDLLNYLGEAASEPFQVDGTTIDKQAEYFSGKIDIIKIDVEGAEPLAFGGGTEFISRNPNLQIVMEWSPGQIRAAGFDVGEFLSTLSGLGLGFHQLDAAATRLTREELLNIPYASGILLSRNPRLGHRSHGL